MGYNKIMLSGEQICDYLYIQKSNEGIESFSVVDSEPKEWNENTLLFSKFDENLIAGDSALIGNLEGYEVRRKSGVSSHTDYVTTISGQFASKYVIDYAVANNTPYIYYLYPFNSQSDGGVTLTPLVSEQITPEWEYWCLLVVDETDKENVFYLNKMFKFELNLATDDINNNAVISINQNFTRYPTVQIGTANYWSGALSSLCGFISCNDYGYVETLDMIKELKELTSDTRRKFLKDMDGNVWEVKITAPINISTEDKTLQRVKTAKIAWTEVGDVTGISIINNPRLSTQSWVLTRDGYAAPYKEYVWSKDDVWDNSKFWTAKDDVLSVNLTNAGRDLYGEEGDEV